jgi:CRP-like cAMP-binding protein
MSFKEFLETAPEFSGLTPHDIDDFEHIMSVSEHPDEYEFFKEGTAGRDVLLIVKGEVSVTHNKGTERGSLEIKRLKAGEMFGMLSAVTGIKHEASCQAIGPVTIASMPRQAFTLLFGSNSTLGLHFQQLVTAQLAKDYSSLVSLLRRALFAENEEEIQAAFEQYSEAGYNGPEKRSGDRRDPIH